MAEKLRVIKKLYKMKRLFLVSLIISGLVACNGNEEADRRQYNSETQTTSDGGQSNSSQGDDTTATLNNSAYNTDSASGQGNRYDSSNSKTR